MLFRKGLLKHFLIFLILVAVPVASKTKAESWDFQVTTSFLFARSHSEASKSLILPLWFSLNNPENTASLKSQTKFERATKIEDVTYRISAFK